jgi:apolipoprotein N-acyltransferase
LTAYARPGDGVRWALLALGLLFDALWLPPGVLGIHLPALVLLGDLPFLLLVWHEGGARWKRWAWLYGLLHFGCALHWLVHVGTFQLVGAAFILAPVTLLLAGALRLGARRGVPFVPLVGVAVVLEEMLRTIWFGGMPWPQRSLGLVSVDGFRAGAALAGAYGLSFLAGMASAWAAGVVGVVRARADLQPRLLLRLLATMALPALFAAVLLMHGHGRIGSVQAGLVSGAVGVSPPVLIVQAAVPQSLKHALSKDAGNQVFNRHTSLTREGLGQAILSRQPHVLAVLWPETMIPWPFVSPSLAHQLPEEWANQAVIVGRLKASVPEGMTPPQFLVGGIHQFEVEPGKGAGAGAIGDHDSLLWVDPVAAPALDAGVPPLPPADAAHPPWVRARHDKVVRVPGGEYTPGEDLLPILRVWRDNLSQIPEIARGADDQAPFALWRWARMDPGGKVESHELRAGTVICFEVAFPARCRAWRRAGCQVLLNPANYGWFGQSAFRAQIRAVAALRAAELGMTVAMAGNTGPTVLFDPSGAAYGRFVPVPLTPEGLVAADVPPQPPEAADLDATSHRTGFVLDHLMADDHVTAYAQWGDLPWLLLAGLLALLAALARRGRAPSPVAGGTSP